MEGWNPFGSDLTFFLLLNPVLSNDKNIAVEDE